MRRTIFIRDYHVVNNTPRRSPSTQTRSWDNYGDVKLTGEVQDERNCSTYSQNRTFSRPQSSYVSLSEIIWRPRGVISSLAGGISSVEVLFSQRQDLEVSANPFVEDSASSALLAPDGVARRQIPQPRHIFCLFP